VDEKACNELNASRRTTARYGLKISDELKRRTIDMMKTNVVRHAGKYSFNYICVAIILVLTKQYIIRISWSLFYSISIMFDEASDINMNANLNVFVNVLLTCGNVKTLTLSLVGSILVHAHIILITCSCCIYCIIHCRFQYCITITRIELEAKDAGNVYRVLLDVLMEYCSLGAYHRHMLRWSIYYDGLLQRGLHETISTRS
jgi:hypothetical protein